MAAGFFAVFDDIAMLLDDAATMGQVATKKTAGVLGDDLAVGAQKASGFSATRELPVLWKITKGSFRNKLIILPIAFLLSAFAPWIIIPILMLGGLYLAFEGAEKIYEVFVPHEKKVEKLKALSEEELMAYEQSKVKSAILTDFILSIEIIVLALGTVLDQNLPVQILVVSFIAIMATIGVYGLVAILVRMDDVGLKIVHSAEGKSALLVKFGEMLIAALPKVIKLLTVVGTVAMLMVAGGIFVHNIHALHEALHFMPSLLGEVLVGLIVGLLVLGIEKMVMRLLKS
jgi:predicted DNA repair protein MutK